LECGIYIFGAVCPAKDKALGLMLPVANTAGMIEHLRLISLYGAVHDNII
jgi:hypothetical protein